MTIGRVAVTPTTTQLVQHAERTSTTVLNISDDTIVYVSDKPVVIVANAIPLAPGYGLSVAGGVELWAVTTVDTAEVVIANGVGPIFATGV